MSKAKGLLVTLEGTDGAGKSTQAGLLAGALRRRGRAVVLTREPGGSPSSARIRALLLDRRLRDLHPEAELLLFAADRRQHVADTLEPALRRGAVVLCDRFTDSTLAYQGAGGLIRPRDLAWIAGFAASDLRPDLTLLFDLPVGEGLKRARRSKGVPDRMEAATLAYFGRVRAGFLRLARKDPARVKRIAVPGRSPKDIAAEALRHVEALLERR